MSRKTSNPTAETLRELEASGDRLAQWAADNAALILGAIAAVLVIAAGVGFWLQHRSNERDAAANALAFATSEYRQAMGADPIAGPIPEPANAELAVRTRREFAERFAAVAREHDGTTAGAIAWLEAGAIQEDLDQLEDAAASFAAARDAAPEGAVGALASRRLAGLAEQRGDMAAAAEAYERAAAVDRYPLRASALADAARCWAAAGESDAALEVFQRLESEFPDELVVPQVEALLAELRLRDRL